MEHHRSYDWQAAWIGKFGIKPKVQDPRGSPQAFSSQFCKQGMATSASNFNVDIIGKLPKQSNVYTFEFTRG